MHRFAAWALGFTTLFVSAMTLAAQGGANAPPRYVPEDNRPPLAFREDFLDQPTETPVTMASIKNHELRFTLWGPGKDKSIGPSRDWQISEMPIADIQWYELHTETMTDYPAIQNPDLSKVAEIGWTDLSPGSGHGTPGGSTRVDWIKVYGHLVPQNSAP
jgi:hypothetical protein